MLPKNIINIDTYKNLVAQPRLFGQYNIGNFDELTPVKKEKIVVQEPFNANNYKNNSTEKELQKTLKKLIEKDQAMKEMQKYIHYLRLNQKQQFEHVDITSSAVEAEKMKQKHKKSKQSHNLSDDEDLNNMSDAQRQAFFLKQLQKFKNQMSELEINRRAFPETYDEVINLLVLQNGQNQLNQEFSFDSIQEHPQDDFLGADAIQLPETIKNYYRLKDMSQQLQTQDDFFDQLVQRQQEKMQRQQNAEEEAQDDNYTKFTENDYYIE